MNSSGIRRRPQQARASLNRDNVLDAAQRLIYERGYGDMTVAEIARRSGVSKPNVYQMFANKAAILAALIERRTHVIDEYRAPLIDAAAATGWRETARQVIMSAYRLHLADPTLDPLYIAGQDVAETRLLNVKAMDARATIAAAEMSAITGLPNDQRMFDFALISLLSTSAIFRHTLNFDAAAAERLLEEEIEITIIRLEKMGAK